MGQISEMWKLIAAQAEYSFNLGHSTAYGLTSYVTAWLKLYHPTEFMTALLISEIGDYSQTTKYIDECRRMGIRVLPPNINESDVIYTVRDRDILFGLQSIKGVGEKASIVIKNERENGRYGSFENFYERLKNDNLINTTTIISLIKSGAFGSNKTELLYNFSDMTNPIRIFTPVKSLPTRKELQNLGIIQDESEFKDKERCLVRYNEYKKKIFDEEQTKKQEKHRAEFENKYMQHSDMWEFETLSIFLTDNPLKQVENYIFPFSDAEDGELTTLFGTISNIKRKKQKNGKTYAYIELLTSDGLIEGTVFNQQYTEHQDIIAKGKNIVVIAEKSGGQFTAKNLSLLSEWIERIKNTDINSLLPHKRIVFDIEMFGKTEVVFPEVAESFYVIVEINKENSPKLLLYSLSKGNMKISKIKKKIFDANPVQVGWVIKEVSTSWEGKWRLVKNGDKTDWIQIEEKEEWITSYDVVRK